MAQKTALEKQAMQMLKETSRTFYIPIKLLNLTLRKTVGSAYLCMRAIDEIEDHQILAEDKKIYLLNAIGELLEGTFDRKAYEKLIRPYESLPEVTRRLADWLEICPSNIRIRIQSATQEMANGMAKWVKKRWHIQTVDDLNDYTYYVAGLVGVMLSDIWEWYDGTETDRTLAVGYGRGLQAVNILRNQQEDYEERGVSFFPVDWGRNHMFEYAEKHLRQADKYMKSIEHKNILLFCKIPLELAKKTLQVMKKGEKKMSRLEVESTVQKIKQNTLSSEKDEII